LVIAVVMGGAGVALGTAAGRSIVVRTAVAVANRALDGRVTVGEVTGSLADGLKAQNVAILGTDGAPLATIQALTVRYRLRDLLSGHIVMGQVQLTHPSVFVTKLPDGRLNFQKIFRLGGPSGGGAKPLVAFHDVQIDSGEVTVNTPAGPGDTARVARNPRVENGRLIRRVENLNARLSYLRVSSPFPGENPIFANIDELRARVSDPNMVIREGKGRIEQAGDSLNLDFTRLVLGSSTARISGSLAWPTDTIVFNLAIATRSALLDDIRPLVPVIPRGLEAAGAFTAKSLAGDITSLSGENLSIVARREGGTITGRAGLVLGPRSGWSVRGVDLKLDSLDLEYIRPFLDTLPIAGRLNGSLKADGPHDHMNIDADVVFRDSLVPGWPVTTLSAAGTVATGTEAGVVFQDFAIRNASVDLSTVRRMLPAVALQGIITANGTLAGPWLESEFNGTVRHRDAPYPETVATGVIQIDGRADTLGVWGRLAFDSLHLPGFWTSYPQFHLLGDFAGNVRLEGYLTALHLVADLHGPPGRFKGEGTLTLRSPHYAARNLDVDFRAVDTRRMYTEPVETDLNGVLRGGIEVDTLKAPAGTVAVVLDSSHIGGSPIDSARARVSLGDSLVRVDSLAAWAPDSRLGVHGALALRSPRSDSLHVAVQFDSVKALEPVLSEWFVVPEDTARRPLGGTVTIDGALRGSLDDLEIAAEATAPRLRWGTFTLGSGRVRLLWSSRTTGRAQVFASADSLQYGSLGFARLVAGARGHPDSLRWGIRGRNGPDAGVTLGGQLIFDSSDIRIPLDSADLALPSVAWALVKPTVITISDSTFDLGTLTLKGADDTSRVEFVGSIPRAGHGRLSVSLASVSMRDVVAMLQKESQSIGGRLEGTIDIAGTARSPQMHSELAIHDMSFSDFHVPRVDGVVDYAARRLGASFTLRGTRAVIMDIKADLPLDLALRDAAANRQIPGDLSIRAVADSVDLAILEAISTGVRNASGRVDGDFGIVGTWDQPRLNGSLTLRNGGATYPGIGVRHDAINGQFSMHGDTVEVKNLSLKSGSGSVNVAGNIRLDQLTHPVFDVHMVAQDFFVMDVRNFVTMTTTGEFDLVGPMVGVTLRGGGTVTKGTLHFADLVNKRVLNLEDSIFRRVIDTTLIRRQGLGRTFQSRFIDSLVVDSLKMDMGNEVWMRSTEANIQLAGSAVFSKEGGQYQVEGTLNTPRGTYRLPLAGLQQLSREFSVTRGDIRFLGTADLNALVDIDAQYLMRRRVGDDVRISVHIGGTLYVPTIALSSDARPPIPEAEIISYLLFGGPVNTTSAGMKQAQQAAVQSVVSALSGQIENALISNLGLLGSPITPDYLQITPGDSWVLGTQVQFGWQWDVFGVPVFLTPTTRWGCQRTLVRTEDLGISAEVRLTKEWRVSGSVEPTQACNASLTPGANNRQAGLDVLWEKSY
jgi:translocation and assembly module TamB